MSKRFTDTEKWKKNFFKNLPPAYKCFWNFITDDCDHSGIWEVEDPQIIAVRIGEKIDLPTALFAFNEDEKRVHVFDGGRKWFIIPFVSFQYGDLNPNNRLHESVRRELIRKDLIDFIPVRGPLNTPKELDKEKDKELDKEIGGIGGFEKFWEAYPKKRSKAKAEKAWKAIKPSEHLQDRILGAIETAKTSADWRKDGGQFIPYPASWLNSKGWEDSHEIEVKKIPMNLNKIQTKNMEALSDFLERKGKAGPENIHAGNSNPIRSISSDKS